MRLTLLSLAVLAGCEKDLLADLPDAPPEATGCPTPETPLAAGTFKVYLNTEGVTLTMVPVGFEDSRTNKSNLIVNDNTVVPQFLAGDPDRQVFIDGIVTTTQAAVAPYSLDIVTTRPASGDYEMFVIGGDDILIRGEPTPGSGGVGTYRGCGKNLANRNHISIYYDFGAHERGVEFGSVEDYANFILAEIGLWGDLVPTAQANDCMCRNDAICGADYTLGSVCTFGSNVPTTTAIAGDGTPFNCNISPADEPALLKAAYGCR